MNVRMEKEHQLAADSLSIGESIIMGTAGAAPAFSISAVTATLVASIGTLAPASILYCGLIMFGITLAFMHLNKVIVNAGASYAWVSRIFGQRLGFFAGWALLVSSAVFMVSGSIPAATATLLLISPHLVNNPAWVMLVAAFWLTLISAVTLKGIKPTSYLQVLMTGIEVLILVAIIVAGVIQYAQQPTHIFSWSWFKLTSFTPDSFATGALTALFLYWGWDVTLNLNEETKQTKHAPGLGAFWSVLIIILLFVCFTVVALLVLSDSEIQASGTNIIFAIADKLFPRPWSYIAVLSVLLSTIGTLETTIVQFTRTMFAEGRDGALHARYAKLHQTWATPWVAILFIWGFGMLFLLLSSNFSTVTLIIKDSVNAIGFQVAFYYSLTGFACAWYYRTIWKNVSELIGYILWPVFSSVFLIFIAGLSIPTFDIVTNIVGIGGLVIGIIPFLWNGRVNK
jgi:amino acid transporter